MSIHALKWAWGQQCPNPTAKLVLMALADHANAEGECYPTMKRVAEMASCSPRTVSRHIQLLEDEGLVSRVERRIYGGEFRGFLYQLNMPLSSGQVDQWTSRPVDAGGRDQWTTVSPLEPAVEPSVDPLPPQAGDEKANPRAVGANPRALGTNPRAVAKRQRDQARKAHEVGTPEYEERMCQDQAAREGLAGM